MAGWVLIAAERYRSKTKARTETHRAVTVAYFRRNRPRPNVVGPETAPLKRGLEVVIPVIGGSPQARADCMPLLPASPFPVERHTFVIQSHIIEVNVSARQKPERVDCICGPKTITARRWIVEVTSILQSRFHRKEIDGPVSLHPQQARSIHAASDIAAIASRNKVFRSESDLFSSNS